MQKKRSSPDSALCVAHRKTFKTSSKRAILPNQRCRRGIIPCRGETQKQKPFLSRGAITTVNFSLSSTLRNKTTLDNFRRPQSPRQKHTQTHAHAQRTQRTQQTAQFCHGAFARSSFFRHPRSTHTCEHRAVAYEIWAHAVSNHVFQHPQRAFGVPALHVPEVSRTTSSIIHGKAGHDKPTNAI